MLLDPIQQAHEDAIQAAFRQMVASAHRRDRIAHYERMRDLIRSRDPEVLVALETERMRRAGGAS